MRNVGNIKKKKTGGLREKYIAITPVFSTVKNLFVRIHYGILGAEKDRK